MNDKAKNFSRFVLEKISEVGELSLEGLFPRNRVEGKMWRRILGLPNGYEFSRPNFSAVLARLRQQGLIAKRSDRRWASWVLTPRGKEKINVGLNFKKVIKPDGIPRLVMYDIPEVERRKRDLIRDELTGCGYNQFQRSIWIGYSPLPEDFLKSLKDLRLQGKVHIMSVDKKGTIDLF
ncbi:MAG: hypothetical protein HYT38_02875 [Candidatus Sungbacteria bacterium]|uniref:Transcriptional repressor PaaX-like central Cas2-like domain-containing protein n=1 Tax=Candidatus Sungiibacteriota bacterium TaxID=2750080 RepID=A0A9D6DPN0_9BACT|nr:hypothetical protein [Candidatus Sungbacteria bacterium]